MKPGTILTSRKWQLNLLSSIKRLGGTMSMVQLLCWRKVGRQAGDGRMGWGCQHCGKWTSAPWCCLVDSIHPSPRYQNKINPQISYPFIWSSVYGNLSASLVTWLIAKLLGVPANQGAELDWLERRPVLIKKSLDLASAFALWFCFRLDLQESICSEFGGEIKDNHVQKKADTCSR